MFVVGHFNCNISISCTKFLHSNEKICNEATMIDLSLTYLFTCFEVTVLKFQTLVACQKGLDKQGIPQIKLVLKKQSN